MSLDESIAEMVDYQVDKRLRQLITSKIENNIEIDIESLIIELQIMNKNLRDLIYEVGQSK